MADDTMMAQLLGSLVGKGATKTEERVLPEVATLQAMQTATPWLTQGPGDVSLSGGGQIAQFLFGHALQDAAVKQAQQQQTGDLLKAYEIMKLQAETRKALAEGQLKEGEYKLLQVMAPDIFGEDATIGTGQKPNLPAGTTLRAGGVTMTTPKSIDALLTHRVLSGEITIDEAAGILGNIARARQLPSEKERGAGRLTMDVSQMTDEELLEALDLPE